MKEANLNPALSASQTSDLSILMQYMLRILVENVVQRTLAVEGILRK